MAAAGASLFTTATIKIVDYFKFKNKKNEAEIAKVRKKIINDIKEYDTMHLDEKGGNEDE